MYRSALPLLFFASAFAAGPISLPSNFKLCSKSAPSKDNCFVSAVAGGIKNLGEGSKQLGVLPIDPLLISTLDINQGTGPVAINLGFQDLSIEGISTVIVTDAKADLTGTVKTITIDLDAPGTLVLSGKYKVDGQVLILPIKGDGDARLDLTKVKANIVLTGKLAKKDGIEYLVFSKAEFKMDPENVKLDFKNLFGGDKTLGDNMNKFLNENWPEVYSELRNSIQQAFASTILHITNSIFTKVPYDKIFLD